ncbi:HAMP domain-containing protein [bacterium]|nr:HAMP domain-containing protein [bacterium]
MQNTDAPAEFANSGGFMFANASLSRKLISSFVVVAVLIAVVGLIGFVSMERMKDATSAILDEDVPLIDGALRMTIMVSEARADLLAMSSTQSDAERDRLRNRFDARVEAIRSMSASLQPVAEAKGEEIAERFNDLDPALDSFVAEAEALREAIEVASQSSRRRAKSVTSVNLEGLTEAYGGVSSVLQDLEYLMGSEMETSRGTVVAAESTANLWTFAITGLGMVIGVLMGLGLSRHIAEPMNRMIYVANHISRGDLDHDIQLQRGDEVGRLADAFRAMQASLSRKVDVARQIAGGNLSVDITRDSDKDALGAAMIEMREQINTLIEEIAQLVDAVKQGDLSRRGDLDRFDGAWEDLIRGINDLIEAFVKPIKVTSDYIDRIGKGDIPAPITDTYHGEFNEIKDSVNDCIHAINLLIEDTHLLVDAAVEGQLDQRADDKRHVGEYRTIIRGINDTLDAMIRPVQEASEVLEKMSHGDLTNKMAGDYRGDFAKIRDALNSTLDALNDLLGEVSTAVQQVGSGAGQVSDASQSLSQGATQQASSLEEVTASVTDMADRAASNESSAQEANGISDTAREAAEKGNRSMATMIDAMNKINDSSSQVAKVIKVIDEIAFQTNLLALNAAVEAARAGVHGKGFAVVAEEVRSLAQRSAKAAKETTEMIEDSIKRVESGNKIATETDDALTEIVEASTKVSNLVEDIALAAGGQKTAIQQVNDALEQIEAVTQRTSSSAEESASAAEELSGQAEQLRVMLARFKLLQREWGGKTESFHSADLSDERQALLTGNGRGAGSGRTGEHRYDEPDLEEEDESNDMQPDDYINLDDDDFGSF